jgi:hypothetical protein
MELKLVIEFSKEEIDYLWSVGVCLDDWNFALIGEPEILGTYMDHMTKKTELRLNNPILENLLSGRHYEYRCYLVNFRGKECAICIQYH